MSGVGLLVAVVVLGCLVQKLCQIRDLHGLVAPLATGKPRLYLLEQPAVAVGIAERRPGEVGATLGIRARQRASVPALWKGRLS